MGAFPTPRFVKMSDRHVKLLLLSLPVLFICISSSFLAKNLLKREQADSTPPKSRLLKESDPGLHILLYETSDVAVARSTAFQERAHAAGIKSTFFGQGSRFEGFGSKYVQVRPLLERMEPNDLVVLADSRDVLLNVPSTTEAPAALDRFFDAYRNLSQDHPDAVIVSAEYQCCVSALCHSKPGDYFDAVTGERNHRACSSGEDGCPWIDNDNVAMWDAFMVDVAGRRTVDGTDNPYLNAGLIAGYPKNLLHLIDRIDLASQEDDQAVLTGLLHHDPASIVLDYDQQVFGNNRWTEGLVDGCVFEADENKVLIQKETQTRPLIVHTSGKFFECLDLLWDKSAPESNIVMERRDLVAKTKESFEVLHGDDVNARALSGKSKGKGKGNYGKKESSPKSKGKKESSPKNYGKKEPKSKGKGKGKKTSDDYMMNSRRMSETMTGGTAVSDKGSLS